MEVTSTSLKRLVVPLIDLIHGDIVLDDICCRRVACAFVTAHETALRQLSASCLVPSGLQKAMETYCVRMYLSQSPALLQKSPAVVHTLQQLADTLKSTDFMATEKKAGHAHGEGNGSCHDLPEPAADLAQATAILQSAGSTIAQQLDTLCHESNAEAIAQLLTALGEAVLAYILHAVQQCAQLAEDYLGGATWQSTSVAHASYHTALQQFAISALAHRNRLKQARADAQEAEVQELLFGSAGVVIDDEAARPNASPSPPSQEDFSGEVRASMADHPPAAQPPHREPLLKHPIPPSRRRGRAILFVGDSIEDDILAMRQSSTSPPPPSSVQHQTDAKEKRDTEDAAPTQGPTSDVTPSPVIVVDPSTLVVEMSAVVAASSSQDPDVSDVVDEEAPHRKRHKADPVLIGASETSILRMMETQNGSLGFSPPDSTSSPVPLGAQVQQLIGGTPASSAESSTSVPATPVAAVTVEDAWEGVRKCVQQNEAESRSYFLCAATHRFEPCVARGFFQ